MENFRIFYRKHRERLFAYLMRSTGDYYLSGDILQESFTRYLEKYGKKETNTALPVMFFVTPRQELPVPTKYRFVLYQPDVKQLQITGSFLGWAAVPMQRSGTSGYWEAVLEVPAGEHRLCYIIEGRKRIPDPTIPIREKDDFGGENSILAVNMKT